MCTGNGWSHHCTNDEWMNYTYLHLCCATEQGVTAWVEVMKGLDLGRKWRKGCRKLGPRPLPSSALAPEHLSVAHPAVWTTSVAEFNLTPSPRGEEVCALECAILLGRRIAVDGRDGKHVHLREVKSRDMGLASAGGGDVGSDSTQTLGRLCHSCGEVQDLSSTNFILPSCTLWRCWGHSLPERQFPWL